MYRKSVLEITIASYIITNLLHEADLGLRSGPRRGGQTRGGRVEGTMVVSTTNGGGNVCVGKRRIWRSGEAERARGVVSEWGVGSRGRGVAPLSPPGAVGERVRRRPSPCSDLVA